jgi:DNA-binding beta-propeller fold protein YncE
MRASSRKRSSLKRVVILAIFLGFLAGCAGTQPVPAGPFWPPPPQEPRIEYVRSIYGSHSLTRSFFGKVKDFLFGKSPDMALGKPYGLALKGQSTLFIVDTAKKGLMVLNLDTGKVDFIDSLGPYGRLQEPINVLLGDDGRVYVADTGLGKIVVFDANGVFVRFIGEGELGSPVGMALGPGGKSLYVTDTNLHMVLVFSPEGDLLKKFGGRGDMQGQFYHPLGIAVNNRSQVLVVDSFHFAVQVFDLDGNYLSSFGSTSKGLGSMARPRSIAVDSEGLIYVTDALKNNVQIFDQDGGPVLEFGSRGFGPGQFRLPAGIFYCEDERIFVVDSINKRIQEFRNVASVQGS